MEHDISKRKGFVRFHESLIRSLNSEQLSCIFSVIFPIRIELSNDFNNNLTYYCYSKEFEIVEELHPVPEYLLTLSEDGDSYKLEINSI